MYTFRETPEGRFEIVAPDGEVVYECGSRLLADGHVEKLNSERPREQFPGGRWTPKDSAA